jgi:PhnB protein
MKMNPYVNFKGDCEEAFRAYEKTLGGRVGEIFRYGGSPMAGDIPPDWADKVMHGSIEISGHVLIGGDVAPGRYESPKGVSFSLQIASPEEAERLG